MHCEAVRGAVAQLVTGKAVEPEVHQHLHGCWGCQEYYRDLKKLKRGLEGLPRILPELARDPSARPKERPGKGR